MKKVFIFFLSLVVGVSFAFLIYSQYDATIELKPVFQEEIEELYFLQFGVYSSKESMEENTLSLMEYIYEEQNGNYHVYVGMTKKEEVASKIEGFYQKKGYPLYRKKISVKGRNFLQVLDSFDLQIESAKEEQIPELLRELLKQYKELILDVKNEGTT